MKRLQVYLPNAIYERLDRIAKTDNRNLSEVAREALLNGLAAPSQRLPESLEQRIEMLLFQSCESLSMARNLVYRADKELYRKVQEQARELYDAIAPESSAR